MLKYVLFPNLIRLISVLNTSFEPVDFVLFGTAGDLARRKLLPSLYELEKANLIKSQLNRAS